MNTIFRKLIKLMVGSYLMVGAGSAMPGPSEVLSTEELREIQGKLNQRQELSLSFSQTKISALRPLKPSVSSGRAFFLKPSKFRWEIEKPQSDILIFDGKYLYNYKKTDKVVTRFKTEGERTKEIHEVLDFVLDFDALLNRYRIVESNKMGVDVNLKLKPKQGSNITQIEITIDSKESFVKALKMQFDNKNSSDFSFFKISQSKIDRALLEVPTGLPVTDGI